MYIAPVSSIQIDINHWMCFTSTKLIYSIYFDVVHSEEWFYSALCEMTIESPTWKFKQFWNLTIRKYSIWKSVRNKKQKREFQIFLYILNLFLCVSFCFPHLFWVFRHSHLSTKMVLYSLHNDNSTLFLLFSLIIII